MDGDPYPLTHADLELAGRKRWRTPIRFPWGSASASLVPSDRQFSGCPERDVDPWIWQAISTWQAWTAMGRPLLVQGGLADQPAREMDAMRILDDERGVIDLAHAEEHAKARG